MLYLPSHKTNSKISLPTSLLVWSNNDPRHFVLGTLRQSENPITSERTCPGFGWVRVNFPPSSCCILDLV